MEIVNFFEKMAGRWFSQRTTHALSTQQSKAGKSDLEVAFLAADAAEVQQLYQTADLPSQAAEAKPVCGLKIHQSSTLEGDSKPTVLTTLLVPLTPIEGSGILLRQTPQSSQSPQSPQTSQTPAYITTYTLADDVLTIISKTSEARSEERLWFINENVRMRTSMSELENGLRIASFCSEIRLGVKPPKAD